MSVMVMTCPHCSADNMTFNVRVDAAHKLSQYQRSALAFCARCDMPVVVMAKLRGEPRNRHISDWKLPSEDGDLQQMDHLQLTGIWPVSPVIDAPQHLPEKVLRAYLEAATARRVQLWNAACSSYRRCLELTLKQFAPDVSAPTLVKRIDKLAAEHRITPDLKDWAHELRLDGNEAVHGDEDATQEITDQMHHLTYFLLTYLYTLPRQVEAARERRQESADL